MTGSIIGQPIERVDGPRKASGKAQFTADFEPSDVAHAVRFFCAEEAGFVTGQVLYVCGGTSVGSLTL